MLVYACVCAHVWRTEFDACPASRKQLLLLLLLLPGIQTLVLILVQAMLYLLSHLPRLQIQRISTWTLDYKALQLFFRLTDYREWMRRKAADPDLSRPEFKCQLVSDSLCGEHESLIWPNQLSATPDSFMRIVKVDVQLVNSTHQSKNAYIGAQLCVYDLEAFRICRPNIWIH